MMAAHRILWPISILGILCCGGLSTPTLTSLPPEPPAKQWKMVEVEPMTQARAWHTSTLLPDGKVLVTGGTSEGVFSTESTVLKSVELYDPESRTFSVVKAELNRPRLGHSAALLPDGKVLIAGGMSGANRFVKEVELWDPILDEFRVVGATLGGHEGQQMFLRPDGKVQIVGGLEDQNQITGNEAFTEVFDPVSGISTLDFELSEKRQDPTLIPVSDSEFMLLGGENGSGSWHQLDLVELYDTDGSQPNPKIQDTMPIAFTNNTGVNLPAGKIVVAGGYNQFSGGIDDIVVIDYKSIPYQISTHKLKKVREKHQTIVFSAEEVAFVGGQTFTGLIDTTFLSDIEMFNLSTGVTSVFPLSMKQPRANHTVTPLSDRSFLIVGGYCWSYVNGGYYPATSACELLVFE